MRALPLPAEPSRCVIVEEHMRTSVAARLLVVVSAVLIGRAAVAAGTNVRVEGDAPSGEVCRFPANGNDPFSRWLTSGGGTCVPSGSDVTFPPGRWNVFGRANGLVSADPLLVDAKDAPDSLTLPLLPAATLTVQLPADEMAVVYVPKRVVAFPAAGRTVVPAGQELWIFVLPKNAPAAKSGPLAVFVVSPLDAGSDRVVDTRDVQQTPAVVAWLQLAEADRAAMKRARGVELPRVRLTSGGKELEAGGLPAPEALDGAMVLFRGAAPGSAQLQLTGRGWLPAHSSATIGHDPVTLVRQPLVARASATLMVTWSTREDLASLDRALGSCQPSPPGQLEVTVFSCPAPEKRQPLDRSKCQPIRKENPLEMAYGTMTINDVPPSLYLAELRFGKLPPITETEQLGPLDQKPLSLTAIYEQGYGSLTRGGKPLGEDARIEFPRGLGFSPRDGSDYFAVFPGGLGGELVADDARVDIITCRGMRTFILTDRPLIRRQRYDLDIPDNSLTVTVVDTFTHMVIPTATLKYTVMSLRVPRTPKVTRVFQGHSDGARNVDSESGTGSESSGGRFVLEHVPHREIRLEVSNPGYKKQELEPFTMGKTDKKEIEVQLVPLSGSQGRIVSARPFERGTLLWTSATGAETERADLSPDGTFYFEQGHYRGETMTVVSFSHPLWILPAPLAERSKPLEVRFPDSGPVRDAEISIPGNPPRFGTLVGLIIGGLHVPPGALALHQNLRNESYFVHGDGPLAIRELAETGPIDVLRGPSLVVAIRAPGEFVPTAKKRLEPGNKIVVFDGK